MFVARRRRNREGATFVFEDQRSETVDIVAEPCRGVVNGPAVRSARRDIEVAAQGARGRILLRLLQLLRRLRLRVLWLLLLWLLLLQLLQLQSTTLAAVAAEIRKHVGETS